MFNFISFTFGYLLLLDIASSKYLYRCECKAACSADDIDSHITCGSNRWCCTKAAGNVTERLVLAKDNSDNGGDKKYPRDKGGIISNHRDRVLSKEMPSVNSRLQVAKTEVTEAASVQHGIEDYTPVHDAYKALSVGIVTDARQRMLSYMRDNYELSMLKARQKYMLENYNKFKSDSSAVGSFNGFANEYKVNDNHLKYARSDGYQKFVQHRQSNKYKHRFGHHLHSPNLPLHDFLNGHLSRDPAGFQRYLDLPFDFRRPNGQGISNAMQRFSPLPSASFKHLKDFDLHVDQKEYGIRRQPLVMMPAPGRTYRTFTPNGEEVITITEMPIHFEEPFVNDIREQYDWVNNGDRRKSTIGKLR